MENYFEIINSMEYESLLKGHPMIHGDDYNSLILLRKTLESFIYPEDIFLDLIKELKSMSLIIKNLEYFLYNHMEYLPKDNLYRIDLKYKEWFNPNFEEDSKKSQKLIFLITNLGIELCCSDNFIRELVTKYFKKFSFDKKIKKKIAYLSTEDDYEIYNYKSIESHFIDYFENKYVTELDNVNEYSNYIIKKRGTSVLSWGYRPVGFEVIE